jgi:putative transposase
LAASKSSLNGLKKSVNMPLEAKRRLIELHDEQVSIRRQCELVGMNRSSLYYKPMGESDVNLKLMRLIDEQYTRMPYYGSPRMTAWLCRQGYHVNHKRVERLMAIMGLEAIHPGPNTSKRHHAHKIYPYLLSGVKVVRPNQVWSTDITYIRMAYGFIYLVAIHYGLVQSLRAVVASFDYAGCRFLYGGA